MSDDVAAVLELVMQAHLPVKFHDHSDAVLCLCFDVDNDAIFEGPVLHRQHVAEKQKEALARKGYAVVAVPEGVAVAHGARLVRVGFAADTTTRNAEIDELGYFSTDADANRDHSVPLYVIEQPEIEQPEVVLVVDFPSPGPDAIEGAP